MTSILRFALTLSLLVSAFGSHLARGATFTVTNTNASGVGSLNWAIAEANTNINDVADPDDEIAFTVSAPAFPLGFPVSTTLTDTSGKTTITGNFSSTRLNGVLEIATGVTVEVANLIIQGNPVLGSSYVLSGCINRGDLTLETVTFNNCRVGNVTGQTEPEFLGGALYNEGTVHISNGFFSGNAAGDEAFATMDSIPNSVLPLTLYGGTIYNAGTLTMDNTTIRDSSVVTTALSALNRDVRGGALYTAQGANSTLTGCLIDLNATIETVGQLGPSYQPLDVRGTFIYNEGSTTLSGCRLGIFSSGGGFTNEWGSVTNLLGGIYSAAGTLTFENSEIFTSVSATLVDDNPLRTMTETASVRGGGLYIAGGSARVSNSAIYGSATSSSLGDITVEGGGIFVESGQLNVRDSSIGGMAASPQTAGNASLKGGGLYVAGGNTTITNSVLRFGQLGLSFLGSGPANLEMKGGGAYLAGGNVSFINTTVWKNAIASDLSVYGQFTLQGANNNDGSIAGAGIYSEAPAVVSVRNCTIVGNQMDGGDYTGTLTRGAAGIEGHSTLEIANSIVSENYDELGATDLRGTIGSLGFNIFGDTTGTTGLAPGDMTDVGANGLFTEDPNDTSLGVRDYFKLMNFGEANDIGSPALIPNDPDTGSPITTDQRGSNYLRQVETVDVGAIEHHYGLTGPYVSWAQNYGLSLFGSAAYTNDANQDGVLNLQHFANDTDPLATEFQQPVQRIALQSDETDTRFTITIPVRSGATFSSASSPTATVDGIVYTIRASSDVAGNTVTPVEEVTPALASGLPSLSDTDGDSQPNYEYRTFRFAATVATQQAGFLRVEFDEAP